MTAPPIRIARSTAARGFVERISSGMAPFKSKKSKTGAVNIARRWHPEQATAAREDEPIAIGGCDPMLEEPSTPAARRATRDRRPHSLWPVL